MERWRGENPNAGFDLGGGLNSLMDLRFADDILLFAKSASEAIALLDSLLVCFAHVGLQLNATKTVALTNEAQPQPTLRTGNGIVLDILDRDAGHKWLGCILSARGTTERKSLDQTCTELAPCQPAKGRKTICNLGNLLRKIMQVQRVGNLVYGGC